ncbi:MAG: YcxB family protein [Candidatus Acidiferrales bacterium]
MTEIRAQFTYTPEDYAQGQRFWRKYMAPLWTRSVIYLAFTLGIFLMVVGAVLLWIHTDLPIAIFLVAYGVFILLRHGPLQSLRFKREFLKAKTLHSEKTVRIDEEGLGMSSSDAESKIHWNLFAQHRETPDLFLLSMPPRQFYMLPKRAFSQSDQDAIRLLLEQKIVLGKP